MYSVYQHWDPLKTCVVGKSYPPEFYSWIKNTKTRSIFERIAQETEEDYQALIKILEKFDVTVMRPDMPDDFSLVYNKEKREYNPPPMTPRDYFGSYGGNFISSLETPSITALYNNIRDTTWPEEVHTVKDLLRLPKKIQDEIYNIHDRHLDEIIKLLPEDGTKVRFDPYDRIYKNIETHCNFNFVHSTDACLSTALITRIGKDLYFSDHISADCTKNVVKENDHIFKDYRSHFLDVNGHSDGIFCPVVPGLIISLEDIPTYKDTFPDWEVVYLPDQSWEKVKPFCDLKEKNSGKWWIPGEEYNNDVIETVDTWLSKWVGYVEETVFDVNMLVINEKNVIVNNYNKQVFDALERYGVTPHICNFRHRYFWDGGLHCITSDLDREGEMNDYFPERG
jgi:hypothetical protein